MAPVLNVPCQHFQQTRDIDPMVVQCWPTVCDAVPASNQHWFNASVFAGLRSIASWSGRAYCWRRVQADTDPMSDKCWASVAIAGQYLFNPSQYFMLAVPARCFE